MLNIGAGMKAARSHELLSSSQHVPNNGLMDQSTKHKFKDRLGLPSRVKTFGVDVRGVLDLWREADYIIRDDLIKLGLFSSNLSKSVEKFKESGGNATVTFPPLYDNTEIAFELTPDERVITYFLLPVDGELTVVKSISNDKVDAERHHVNFYSLTYQSRAIISAPNEFFNELKKRGKGLIIQTALDGTSDIASSSCLLYQVEYHQGQARGNYITYEQIPNDQISADKAYSKNNLAAIIRS